MEIVGKVAATIQNVLGPEAEELGRATGVIQRRRKFTAVSLLRMLVLTLLRKPDAKATDFQSTAAQLGLDVTSTAVENRFTPQLVGFPSCRAGAPCSRCLAASPQTVDLLNKFTSVRIGDSSTIALPDQLADQFPRCGGILRGLAAMKIHLLCGLPHRLDPPTANHPRAASDATNPIAQEVPRRLCRCSTWATSVWIGSRTSRGPCFLDLSAQHGTSVFTLKASPCAVAIPAQQTGSDRSTCRPARREPSPALPIHRSAVPQEVPTRRQKAYVKAQSMARASREYLNGRTGRSS